jgi:hypothetical protein
MADKTPPGLADIASDWWNAKPQAPVPYTVNGVPVVNQPADRRTLQRNAPAPYLSGSEAIANVLKNTHPLDFARDLAKGTYAAGKAAVTNPMGAIEGVVGAGNAVDQILAARKAEETGKWAAPKKGSMQSLMSPSQLAKWRQEATANYRKVASYYSYVNKDGDRVTDTAALMRNVTQRPMEVLSLLTPAVEATGAKLAQIPGLKTVGNIVQTAGKVGNVVTNPAPYAIAKTVKAISPAVSAGLRAAGVRPAVFTQAGEYTPKMQQAFKDAKVDPALFDSPEMRSIVQSVVNDRGISPAAIKQAVLKSEGIDATRSMTTGERPMAGNVQGEGAARQGAGQNLAQNMQKNVEGAYQQATSHRGVFTNTNDFSSGVRQSVENELNAMGTSLADVQGNVRFAETQKALQGTKKHPGVFGQFDNLSGAKAAPPLTAADLTGATHTFDPRKQSWVDASGAPVTATGKIQYLDAVSNRASLPPTASAPNRLTPQNIDSVRRNVNSVFSKAQGDDAAALAAINRGIDNYVVQNAPNFTGDGAAMARDWANARKTSQLGQQYGNVPSVDPFAPPKPPVTYDPNALGRTEAARGIVQAPAEIHNAAVPTIWGNIRRYIPSVGAGNLAGYAAGTATGIPGAGLIGGAIGGATTGAVRGGLDRMAATRAAQAEFTGAPRVPLFKAPDVRIPTSIAGGVATAAQSDHETPVTAAPAPKVTPNPSALPEVISQEEYEASLRPKPQDKAPALPEVVSPEEYEASLAPQPKAYGGRAAYRAGGKVGGIEHLVQALMTKAKVAKKASDKATEPLLNERDDAIASALAVAQKAI